MHTNKGKSAYFILLYFVYFCFVIIVLWYLLIQNVVKSNH